MVHRIQALARGLALLLSAVCMAATAQPAAAKRKPAPAAASQPAAKGYRTGPQPTWVVEPPASRDATARAQTGGAARRDLLVDAQVNFTLPVPQFFYRHRAVADNASTLADVSQPTITFNPAFQSVVIHGVSVQRDGRRLDRLRDARIELMRREQRLEQQVIDGTETLLVVLTDVRVGEPVELSYTVVGVNPIYEGRISSTLSLAGDAPVEMLHQRILAPADRPLHVRGLSTEVVPERSTEGRQQVLRVLRTQVPAVTVEQGTPPWFKVYPALQVSDFASWGEVDAWARRLFAPADVPGPLVAARIDAFRKSGLAGEALVSEVLRFVQDEVRYFSASLGESSHRPKPAERTLTELLGDCKDKVVLLNALLSGLGFDAKPALVSITRNRGLANYLPAQDQFDHVVTRLELDGRGYYLDATLQGQGMSLASRGHIAYGKALVVGGNGELQDAAPPPQALNTMEYEQRWDLADPRVPARVDTVVRAVGLSAEQWRAGVARGGAERVSEALAGVRARVTPGLQKRDEPRVVDDRETNRFELRQSFQHAAPGGYANGSIELDIAAVEMIDWLTGPPEAQRRSPFLFDVPQVVQARIEVLSPRALGFRPPAPVEVNDRHFRFTSRFEIAGNSIVMSMRMERRSDEVLPGDLARFRENLVRARQQLQAQLKLPLVDMQALRPRYEQAVRKVSALRNHREDALASILVRNELIRVADTEALRSVEPGGPRAARVLASRALASNLLGDFAAGLADAEAALAIDPQSEDALEARAVSLIGAGRADEALAAFQRLGQTARRGAALKWMGAVELSRSRPAEAEKLLQEVVQTGGGDDREFALLWLYLAAEHQGGRGRSAIAPYVDGADPKKLTGAMLHYLDGRIDADTLLKLAREPSQMERLNLAEAYFYIGQKFAAQGRRDEALRWFKRTVETEAAPYREVTFARLELNRGR
jgi:lipoprotein NlpI